MKIRTSIRIIAQLALVSLFIYFFGLSSIQRYYEKEIIVTKKKTPSYGIPFPAITFCPFNKTTGKGWKEYIFNNLSSHCSQDRENISKCQNR